MNDRKIFFAGVAGALIMSAVFFLARAADLTDFSLEMIAGSMVTRSLGAGSFALGFGLHLLGGGLIALLYARGLELLGRSRDAYAGAAFGLLHAMVNGILLTGLIPYIHPLAGIESQAASLMNPGDFGINCGALTPVFFIGLHLAFGAVVGAAFTCRAGAVRSVFSLVPPAGEESRAAA